MYPENFRYTKEHEWVKVESDPKKVKVGITDFAQGALGDIVYIQMPKVGENVSAEKVCGEVESTKSVSEIYSPVSGKVISINTELESKPEVINQDPYGAGWIMEIEISGDSSELLDSAAYETLIS